MKNIALFLALAFCVSSAFAITGRVRTSSLNVRAAPNTHSAVIGSFGSNAEIQIDCQVNGDTISGETGTTSVWYHVPSKGGYVSGAFVSAGSAPGCGGPFTARVNIRGGQPLNVRSGPNTRSGVVGTIPANSDFQVDCQVNGDNISGDSGTTSVWYHVPSRGGYVSGAFVNNNGKTAPGCGNIPTPPSPSGRDCSAGLKNPRTCSEAVAWAEAHLTNSYNAEYKGLCDHFVGLAYGRSASGFYSAMVHWQTTPAQFKHYDRNPPPGALCFFNTSQYGHATICTGGEGIISTDINGPGTLGRTSISGIEAKWRAPFLGWTNPYFHNA